MRIEGESVSLNIEEERQKQIPFLTKGEDILAPNHFSLTDYFPRITGGAREISQEVEPKENPDYSKKSQYYGKPAINEFNGLPLSSREAQRTLVLEDGNGIDISTRM